MGASFVSEAIQPVKGAVVVGDMAAGGPGLPTRFLWRGEEIAVESVLEAWKETGKDKGGSKERYVRKHWYRILTTGGVEMKIYCDRKARSAREGKKRWWLHSLVREEEGF